MKTYFDRRQVIKTGLLGGASLLLPLQFNLKLALAESPSLDHFVDALPIPRVFQPRRVNGNRKFFTVLMRQIKQQLHRDMNPTKVWGYGDNLGASFPGPTFEAYNGENLIVRWKNRLARDPEARHYLRLDQSALAPFIHGATDNRKTVVHLHGGHVPMAVDGDPYETFLPKSSVRYDYPIRQQAATLWYHDHALGITRLNVYMGLAGFFLVRDDNERWLLANQNLPAPEYEIPLVLQDRRFNGRGQLSYDRFFDDMFLGDTLLVNGKVWPYLNVERRQYRFRLLNGSNSRAYILELPDQTSFTQIGSDGGFLANPVELTQLILTPGERADIIIDFSKFEGGDDVVLTNISPPMFGHPGEQMAKDIDDILQFRVQYGEVDDPVVLPHILQPGGIDQIPLDNALVRDLTLEDFPDAGVGGSKWLINGLGYDDITEFITPGSVEVWNFVNKSAHLHPMHLHLVQFQVLNRYRVFEGETTELGVDANELGWKDTVRVGPYETVSVAVHFPDDPALFGRYPYHCHILEHEDHEMMRQFSLG